VSVFYYKKWPTVQGINKDFIKFVQKDFIGVGIDGVAPGSPAEMAVFGDAARRSYNGFAVCTATGKFLGNADNLGRWVEEYKKLPREDRIPAALVKDAEEKAARKIPAPPPGGLVLNAYCTYLDREPGGEPARAKWMLNDIYPSTMAAATEPATTGSDILWLTEPEWKALVPARPRVGDKVEVPGPVRSRILGLHACDFHPVSSAGRPAAIRAGELGLTVERVTDTAVLIRLEGSARTGKPFEASGEASGCDLQLLGFLEIDRAKGRFTRVDVLGLGEGWGKKVNVARSGKKDAPARRWPIGIALELATGDRSVDRTPPKYVAPYIGYDYFGTRGK